MVAEVPRGLSDAGRMHSLFFFFSGQAVSKNIRDALQKRARDFGIVMEDTAITHLSFSREYTAAVEAKQARGSDRDRDRERFSKPQNTKKSFIQRICCLYPFSFVFCFFPWILGSSFGSISCCTFSFFSNMCSISSGRGYTALSSRPSRPWPRRQTTVLANGVVISLSLFFSSSFDFLFEFRL